MTSELILKEDNKRDRQLDDDGHDGEYVTYDYDNSPNDYNSDDDGNDGDNSYYDDGDNNNSDYRPV